MGDYVYEAVEDIVLLPVKIEKSKRYNRGDDDFEKCEPGQKPDKIVILLMPKNGKDRALTNRRTYYGNGRGVANYMGYNGYGD